MDKQSFEQLLQRYLREDCTDQENWLVEQWYEKIEQHASLPLSPQEQDILEEKLLQNILTEAKRPIAFLSPKPVIRKHLSLGIYAGIAASLLLILTLAWLGGKMPSPAQQDQSLAVFDQKTVLLKRTNSTDKAQTITLEDHSKVILTPGSSISYPQHFTLTKREIQLSGNAFFEVAKNPHKPFFVYSGSVVTQVLGTSFWVKTQSQSKAIEVEVKTGRVSVYENKCNADASNKHSTTNGVVLTPNQKVTFFAREHHLVTSLVEKPLLVNHIEPHFDFNESLLPQVFTELQKGYAIEIVMANEKLNNCTFTGDISGMSLHEQLTLICKATAASYEVRGTRILISGQGCE